MAGRGFRRHASKFEHIGPQSIYPDLKPGNSVQASRVVLNPWCESRTRNESPRLVSLYPLAVSLCLFASDCVSHFLSLCFYGVFLFDRISGSSVLLLFCGFISVLAVSLSCFLLSVFLICFGCRLSVRLLSSYSL